MLKPTTAYAASRNLRRRRHNSEYLTHFYPEIAAAMEAVSIGKCIIVENSHDGRRRRRAASCVTRLGAYNFLPASLTSAPSSAPWYISYVPLIMTSI